MKRRATGPREWGRTLAVAIGACVLVGMILVPALSPQKASASGSALWSLDNAPAISGETGSFAVSCATADYCIELPPNYTDINTRIWSAGAWTTASLVDPGGHLQMNSISCVTPTFCMTGGVASQPQGKGESDTAVIETWDGTNWNIVANPEDTQDSSDIVGVSCAATTSCVAVGTGGSVESWDGTSWTLVDSTSQYRLTSVSCSTVTSCVAVGDGGNSVGSFVLSGGTWTDVPAVSPGDSDDLYSVSCTSPTFCVAVGEQMYNDIGWALTLIETWDGATWSLAPSPNPALDPGSSTITGGILMGVSCVSSAACVAVGYGNGPGDDADGLMYPSEAIVETWDGNAWSLTPTPAPVDPDGEPGVSLYGDACAAGSQGVACMAVGEHISKELVVVLESSDAIGSLTPTSTQLVSTAPDQLTATVSQPSQTNGSRSRRQLSLSETQPTGTVSYFSDGAAIANCSPLLLNDSDQVSCSVTGLPGPFVAVYSGDASFDGSTNVGSDTPLPTTTTTSDAVGTTTTSVAPTTTTTVATTTTSAAPTTTTSIPARGELLRLRSSAIEAKGTIDTLILALQSGRIEAEATYEVTTVTRVKNSISKQRTTKLYGSVEVVVRKGATTLVLRPTAAAERTLMTHGPLAVTERVRLTVAGGTAANQSLQLRVPFHR